MNISMQAMMGPALLFFCALREGATVVLRFLPFFAGLFLLAGAFFLTLCFEEACSSRSLFFGDFLMIFGRAPE